MPKKYQLKEALFALVRGDCKALESPDGLTRLVLNPDRGPTGTAAPRLMVEDSGRDPSVYELMEDHWILVTPPQPEGGEG